jgi:hypothetical protein
MQQQDSGQHQVQFMLAGVALLVTGRKLQRIDLACGGSNARAGRLYVATHQEKPVTDNAGREAMPANRHRWHD